MELLKLLTELFGGKGALSVRSSDQRRSGSSGLEGVEGRASSSINVERELLKVAGPLWSYNCPGLRKNLCIGEAFCLDSGLRPLGPRRTCPETKLERGMEGDCGLSRERRRCTYCFAGRLARNWDGSVRLKRAIEDVERSEELKKRLGEAAKEGDEELTLAQIELLLGPITMLVYETNMGGHGLRSTNPSPNRSSCGDNSLVAIFKGFVEHAQAIGDLAAALCALAQLEVAQQRAQQLRQSLLRTLSLLHAAADATVRVNQAPLLFSLCCAQCRRVMSSLNCLSCLTDESGTAAALLQGEWEGLWGAPKISL